MHMSKACFWTDAEQFFDWLPTNLPSCVERLGRVARKEYESGKTPKQLVDKVRVRWSSWLKENLPLPVEWSAVIETALPHPLDREAAMNCFWAELHEPLQKKDLPKEVRKHLLDHYPERYAQLGKLPQRIRDAVAKTLKEHFDGMKKRRDKIHTAFFANAGDERIANYLQAWQSQDRAKKKLMRQAFDIKGEDGGERFFLSQVEDTGKVDIPHLWSFVGWLQKKLPASEARLKSFLVRLGRALEFTEKRGALPNWGDNTNRIARVMAWGWCSLTVVDGEVCPPLCCFTYPALAKFLTLHKHSLWPLVKGTRLPAEPRTLERAIERLGLVPISKGKIKGVEKRFDKFWFT